MLKTPSPFASYCALYLEQSFVPGSEIAVPRSRRGVGSSPWLRRTLSRRAPMAPASFHLMPESRTAIETSGRPLVVIHAVPTLGSASSMRAPRTPKFSNGLELMCGPLLGSRVAANLNVLPSPSRSLGVSPGLRYRSVYLVVSAPGRAYGIAANA